MITPLHDNILVELKSAFKHAQTTDAKTVETKKQGICVAISQDLAESYPINKAQELLNKTVYFDEFEDTTSYVIDGKKYALIEIKNIHGYEA